MDSETLFDMREPEDARKKKKKAKKGGSDEVHLPRPVEEDCGPPLERFIARVDDHYECPACKGTTADLAEIRMHAGRKKWLITCANVFGCGMSWEVDPIPGVIEQDKQDVYRFRHGMSKYGGMTIDEVAKLPEGIEHLRAQAKVAKDKSLKAAAAAWLLTHDGCTDTKTAAGQG